MLNVNKPTPENETAYAASIAARIKPGALYIPFDILVEARKKYELTLLIDNIGRMAEMDIYTFKEYVQKPEYKTAFKALELSQIEHKHNG